MCFYYLLDQLETDARQIVPLRSQGGLRAPRLAEGMYSDPVPSRLLRNALQIHHYLVFFFSQELGYGPLLSVTPLVDWARAWLSNNAW